MNIVVIQSQYTKHKYIKLSRKLKHNIYHVMNNGLFVPRVWGKRIKHSLNIQILYVVRKLYVDFIVKKK